MTAAVKKVRQARRRRDRADVDLRAAILAARSTDPPATLQAIADAAGVTRQYVWQIEKGIR